MHKVGEEFHLLPDGISSRRHLSDALPSPRQISKAGSPLSSKVILPHYAPFLSHSNAALRNCKIESDEVHFPIAFNFRDMSPIRVNLTYSKHF